MPDVWDVWRANDATIVCEESSTVMLKNQWWRSITYVVFVLFLSSSIATLAASRPRIRGAQTNNDRTTFLPVVLTGEYCPAWVHARYVTTGPDGKPYPTWHPPIDP